MNYFLIFSPCVYFCMYYRVEYRNDFMRGLLVLTSDYHVMLNILNKASYAFDEFNWFLWIFFYSLCNAYYYHLLVIWIYKNISAVFQIYLVAFFWSLFFFYSIFSSFFSIEKWYKASIKVDKKSKTKMSLACFELKIQQRLISGSWP